MCHALLKKLEHYHIMEWFYLCAYRLQMHTIWSILALFCGSCKTILYLAWFYLILHYLIFWPLGAAQQGTNTTLIVYRAILMFIRVTFLVTWLRPIFSLVLSHFLEQVVRWIYFSENSSSLSLEKMLIWVMGLNQNSKVLGCALKHRSWKKLNCSDEPAESDDLCTFVSIRDTFHIIHNHWPIENMKILIIAVLSQ